MAIRTQEQRQRQVADSRRWREKHPGRQYAVGRAWIARNRKKHLAMRAVNRATKNGQLTRAPCEECGEGRTHAHHDDYDEPLVVRWLCAAHHKEWHSLNGPGAHSDTPIRRREKASCYRGVYRFREMFRAQLVVDKKVFRGKSLSELEAARAYDELALRLLGDKAILNFPEEKKRSA